MKQSYTAYFLHLNGGPGATRDSDLTCLIASAPALWTRIGGLRCCDLLAEIAYAIKAVSIGLKLRDLRPSWSPKGNQTAFIGGLMDVRCIGISEVAL